MPTYAVTGANGFVGRQLVQYLASKDYNVVAVVRDSVRASIPPDPRIDIRQADVRDLPALKSAFRQVNGVFHLAALFNRSQYSWQDYRDVNVDGTINVLKAAMSNEVFRVVHCSTVGVATEAHPPPYTEATPYSPQAGDKYEVTKCEGQAGDSSSSISQARTTTSLRLCGTPFVQVSRLILALTYGKLMCGTCPLSSLLSVK